jgi:acyl carrier protein
MEERIRHFLVQTFLFGQDNNFANDESLLDRGVIDSIGMLELISHLEREYGIKVSDEDLLPENFDSVCGIANYVARKLAARVEDRAECDRNR